MSTLLGEARVRIRPDTVGFLNDATRDISRAGSAAGGIFSKAMKTGALALGGISIAAGLAAKSTLDIGVTYQNSLNTLQAVSKATADQMAAVGKTAKTLGSDITLPATSAADAAAAMTELAKGGLSVESSMTAAKGTLQLAAAAGIEAGQAAEYQAQTLNAFGLSADQAGRVADVLANAANAASGEIGDFAQGMGQASAVAAAMGIPLEDVAGTLGLLAKNGIMGSDAGTLLKSALLALQSPSGPAAKAMDALALSAYDASGNFVGLESVFGQLADAQKKMTPEAYAAATSTLFGSDAARLAGIAGKEGAEGFDLMAEAMSQTGSAAEVAQAKSKGVGGAIEGLKSQVETFQIDLFERAAPNIEKLIRFASDNFPKVGEAIFDGIDKGVEVLGDLKDTGVDAFETVAKYIEPVTSELDDFWHGLTEANGPADAFFGTLKVGAGIVIATADALHPLVELGGEALHLFNELPGPIKSVVLAFAALKVATSFDLFGKLTNKGGVVGGVSGAMDTAGKSVVGFASTVRTQMALANMSVKSMDEVLGLPGATATESAKQVGKLSSAASGVAVGFQTYMPTASAAVKNFTGELRSAFDQAKGLQRYNVAQTFGTESLSRGVGDLAGFSAAARSAATQGVGALRSAAGGLTSFMGGPWGVALAAGGVMVAGITSSMQKATGTTDQWAQALSAGGKAARDAADDAVAARDKQPFEWMADLDEWSGLGPSMDDARKKAHDYYETLDPIAQAQASASQWSATLADRIDTLGVDADDTKTAQERLAYWTDQVSSRQGVLADAAKTTSQRLQEQTQAALAGTNADLAASMATTSLTTEMESYKTSMADATLSATEHQQASDQMSQQSLTTANSLAQAAYAHSTATTEEGKQAEADAALLKSLQDTAAQLGDATPQAIKDLIGSLSASASSATTTSTAMTNLGLSVVGIPDAKSVIINAPTAEQEQKLKDLGYQVEHLPNGQVKVTTDLTAAELSLRNFINQRRDIIINSTVQGQGSSGSGGKNYRVATGGPIFGPGTGTSDSIPAWLSDGEYVIKAKSVAKYGYGFLDAVNTGRFADGGLVGAAQRRRTSALAAAPAASTQDNSFTFAPTFVVDERNGSVRDQMGDAVFEMRRLRRGGRV